MSLRVKQDSVYKDQDWWKWSVWLEGTSKELDAVDHVVYTLHPTFPEPVRRVKNRRSRFKLTSTGWGEFNLFLQIALKNGGVRKRRLWLTLAYPAGGALARTRRAPAKGPVVYVSSGAADAAIARRLRDRLEGNGCQVHTMGTAPPGLPPEKWVDHLLGSADVAVFVLSGRPSLWTYTEIEHALTQPKVRVVSVLVGSGAEVPPRLESAKAFHIDSPDEVEAVAQGILAVARAGTR